MKITKLMKRKYTLHLLSSYVQLVPGIIIPLLLTPYMISKLGSDYYGLWVLLGSLIAYFNLSSFGFGTSLLRKVSQSQNSIEINKYLNTTIGFFLLVSIIVFLIFLLLVFNLNSIFLISDDMFQTAQIAFSILYLIFLVNLFFSTFNTLLFAKGMLHIQNMIALFQSIFSAIFIYIVLNQGYSIIAMVSVNFIFVLIFSFVSAYYAFKHVNFTISAKYFDIHILKKMLSPSLHYFLISIAVLVVSYTDNLIISSFIGLNAVALYAVGYKLVEVSQKLLFQIVDILVPDIAKMYGNREYEKILTLHNKVLLYTMLLAVPGYLILFLFGLDILKLWVGDQYAIDENVFTVFILTAFSYSWVHVNAMFIVAMGVHKISSYVAIIEAILNIIFSLILLQYYGLLGVAIGTLFANLVASAWFGPYWFYKQIYKKISEEKAI